MALSHDFMTQDGTLITRRWTSQVILTLYTNMQSLESMPVTWGLLLSCHDNLSQRCSFARKILQLPKAQV